MANNTPSFNSLDTLTPTEQSALVTLMGYGMLGQVMLGKSVGVNMNSTADQSITIRSSNYIIRRIVVTNASASLTTAAGGVYSAASKGGTAIVASGQAYSALTTAVKVLDLTLANTDRRTETTLYLSLTTGQGSAATANIYIFGDKLD